MKNRLQILRFTLLSIIGASVVLGFAIKAGYILAIGKTSTTPGILDIHIGTYILRDSSVFLPLIAVGMYALYKHKDIGRRLFLLSCVPIVGFILYSFFVYCSYLVIYNAKIAQGIHSNHYLSLVPWVVGAVTLIVFVLLIPTITHSKKIRDRLDFLYIVPIVGLLTWGSAGSVLKIFTHTTITMDASNIFIQSTLSDDIKHTTTIPVSEIERIEIQKQNAFYCFHRCNGYFDMANIQEKKGRSIKTSIRIITVDQQIIPIGFTIIDPETTGTNYDPTIVQLAQSLSGSTDAEVHYYYRIPTIWPVKERWEEEIMKNNYEYKNTGK